MMPMRDNHARSDIELLTRRFEQALRDIMRLERALNALASRVDVLTGRVDDIEAQS